MLGRALSVIGLGVLISVAVRADPWPQFRGTHGDGVTSAGQPPIEWDQEKNVLWKAKIPGYGWSSPIIWGDKVFVTTAISDKQKKPSAGFGGGGGFGKGGFGDRRPPDDVYEYELHCLNAADGKLIWKQTVAKRKPTIATHGSNTYATETPATDGERVYAYFGMTGVFCCDFAGQLLWQTDLGSYSMAMGYGTGSSPVLHDGRLFIQCDNEQKSFLVALDAKTGKELWRTARPERTGWSTPLRWKNKQRTEIVCLGSPRVRSYDPATGKELWEMTGLSGQPHASMVASEELLYVGTGGMPQFGGFGGFGKGPKRDGTKPLFAIKAGGSGDISRSESVVWNQSQGGPGMASPVLYDGNLYVLDQRGGLLSCYEGSTGKEVYRERLSGGRGFTSSPLACGGKLFCIDDAGQTYVIQAGPEFKVLGKNALNEMCWSSPAFAGDALYIRTVDHLYCIREKKAGQ